MKRIHPLLFLSFLLCGILGALAFFSPTITVTNTTPETTNASPEPTVAYPPLDEMVGQLFMIGHWANRSVASTTELIKTHNIGGVILMSAPTPTNEIKNWVDTWNATAKAPLLIAIDQEGGLVSRLKNAPYATTSQRQIKDSGSAYTIGQARGSNLHTLGINLNFAPVIETANQRDSFLYDRAFPAGTDHAALAAALLAGMKESHIIGVVKHFPGHADTPDDSHHSLPQVNITRAELDTFTKDFRTLITNDSPLVIMSAHVRYPNIDTKPATLSHFFLTEYLRDELGFTGVVITDDLIMQAIATTTPSDQAAVEAITAGADICLFAAEPEKVSAAIAAVITAVQAGVISEARIQESYDRVIELKANLE